MEGRFDLHSNFTDSWKVPTMLLWFSRIAFKVQGSAEEQQTEALQHFENAVHSVSSRIRNRDSMFIPSDTMEDVKKSCPEVRSACLRVDRWSRFCLKLGSALFAEDLDTHVNQACRAVTSGSVHFTVATFLTAPQSMPRYLNRVVSVILNRGKVNHTPSHSLSFLPFNFPRHRAVSGQQHRMRRHCLRSDDGISLPR